MQIINIESNVVDALPKQLHEYIKSIVDKCIIYVICMPILVSANDWQTQNELNIIIRSCRDYPFFAQMIENSRMCACSVYIVFSNVVYINSVCMCSTWINKS